MPLGTKLTAGRRKRPATAKVALKFSRIIRLPSEAAVRSTDPLGRPNHNCDSFLWACPVLIVIRPFSFSHAFDNSFSSSQRLPRGAAAKPNPIEQEHGCTKKDSYVFHIRCH